MSLFQEKSANFLWVIFGACLFVAFQPQLSRADCSCSIGSNYISNIGAIYQANSCPNDTGVYTYDEWYISCVGNTIIWWLMGQQDLYTGTPEQIIQYHSESDDVVLRNPAGTNIIIVVDGPSSPIFNGTVAGVSIAGKSPRVYQADPPEKLNQYCMPFTNQDDQDGDHFPDCLDCDPEDSNENEVCLMGDVPKNLGKCP